MSRICTVKIAKLHSSKLSYFNDTFVLFFSLKSLVRETSITQIWPKKQVQLMNPVQIFSAYCRNMNVLFLNHSVVAQARER